MRGQISLDFILAIVIVFIAAGTLTVVGLELEGMQKEASVRQQLNTIGTGLAAAISSSAALEDAGTATLSIDVPELLVAGEETPQKCEIGIAGDVITLSYEIANGETIEVKKKFVVPGAMNVPSPFKCGDVLDITKT